MMITKYTNDVYLYHDQILASSIFMLQLKLPILCFASLHYFQAAEVNLYFEFLSLLSINFGCMLKLKDLMDS